MEIDENRYTYVCAAPMSWMQRLRRVFAIDIETCPKCGGRLRVIACVEDPPLIAKILGHVRRREALFERTLRGFLAQNGSAILAGIRQLVVYSFYPLEAPDSVMAAAFPDEIEVDS